jgi:glycosyltransferase involved in cell wall biosynthesis
MISVVIPVYNGENYLSEAVNSVKRQNINTEIIVVDDGSNDNTIKLARSLDCRVIAIAHSGSSAARNAGLNIANGDSIMFLDHDDILAVGALERLCGSFSADFDFISAKVQDFISLELSENEKSKLIPRREPYSGLLTGAYLFKRSVFSEIGGFKENLKTGECIDFLFRCSDLKLRELKLDFVAAYRRLHLSNKGRTMKKQEGVDFSTILRAKIEKNNMYPVQEK